MLLLTVRLSIRRHYQRHQHQRQQLPTIFFFSNKNASKTNRDQEKYAIRSNYFIRKHLFLFFSFLFVLLFLIKKNSSSLVPKYQSVLTELSFFPLMAKDNELKGSFLFLFLFLLFIVLVLFVKKEKQKKGKVARSSVRCSSDINDPK